MAKQVCASALASISQPDLGLVYTRLISLFVCFPRQFARRILSSRIALIPIDLSAGPSYGLSFHWRPLLKPIVVPEE